MPERYHIGMKIKESGVALSHIVEIGENLAALSGTELIKAIENGNLEFVSPSEGIQYTISNDCDGWKADGAEISTGLDGGFYTAETLEELAGYLQQIGDLQVA